jgi:hypothetical protein
MWVHQHTMLCVVAAGCRPSGPAVVVGTQLKLLHDDCSPAEWLAGVSASLMQAASKLRTWLDRLHVHDVEVPTTPGLMEDMHPCCAEFAVKSIHAAHPSFLAVL